MYNCPHSNRSILVIWRRCIDVVHFFTSLHRVTKSDFECGLLCCFSSLCSVQESSLWLQNERKWKQETNTLTTATQRKIRQQLSTAHPSFIAFSCLDVFLFFRNGAVPVRPTQTQCPSVWLSWFLFRNVVLGICIDFILLALELVFVVKGKRGENQNRQCGVSLTGRWRTEQVESTLILWSGCYSFVPMWAQGWAINVGLHTWYTKILLNIATAIRLTIINEKVFCEERMQR